jgi:hypothetical protein
LNVLAGRGNLPRFFLLKLSKTFAADLPAIFVVYYVPFITLW